MAIELVKDKYNAKISTVEIGRRAYAAVKIGGEGAMPFLFREGAIPNAPVVALEILDCEPTDWPQALKEPFGKSMTKPVEWAKKCVSNFGAKALCIRLESIHPDYGNASADKAVVTLKTILNETKVPLIVTGCGNDEKDNEVLPKISQALKDENVLLGVATQNNYKTLAATCLADGHSIIAESPIDINIAKQLNILITDMGFDPSRIVMHPTTASLGYGMEYAYSIMERARLAAFIGDKMLSMPFIVFVGSESWKTKEAKDFGPVQGINWEITTAVLMIMAGAGLIVVRHPDTAGAVAKYVKMLTGGKS